MADENEKVKSLADYLKKLEQAKEKLKNKKGELNYRTIYGDNAVLVYRGHSKESYDFLPSLFRGDNEKIKTHEAERLREIEARRPGDFSGMTTLDKLAKLQHYGFPTRLIDVTDNPLVALYFVVRNSDKNNSNENGDVIVCDVPKKFFRSFESDTAMCLANLANLSPSMKEELIEAFSDYAEKLLGFDKSAEEAFKHYFYNIVIYGAAYEDFSEEERNVPEIKEFYEKQKKLREEFNKKDIIKRFVHLIRAERSYFEPRIVPEDLYRPVYVRTKQITPRIQAQNGAFIVFGLENEIENIKRWTESRLEHILIDKDSKGNILTELDAIGINEGTMFPELEPFLTDFKNKAVK